jgi:hypothetical protein
MQDFMEHAEPTPHIFLLDTNITPIQNNKMQPASSFTFMIQPCSILLYL